MNTLEEIMAETGENLEGGIEKIVDKVSKIDAQDVKHENYGIKERELARIVWIDNLYPHPNPEITSLDIAEVGGWKVIVKRDDKEKQMNRLWVYFEVDSVIPDSPWFTRLNFKSNTIKTMKIMGIVSQGFIIKIEEVFLDEQIKSLQLPQKGESLDVTTILGITKRQDTADVEKEGTSGTVKSFNEVFVNGPPKTNEERLQNNLEMLQKLNSQEYVICEKVDGCSMTVGYNSTESKLKVCSRNYEVVDDSDVKIKNKDGSLRKSAQWQVVEKYNLRKLEKYPNYVFQGELYGDKIQKNRLNIKGYNFAVFNIYDTVKQVYLDYDDMIQICNELELETVRVIEKGDNFQHNLDSLIKLSDRFYPNTRNPAEGIVIRPLKNIVYTTKYGTQRLSFKVINPEYLLKNGQ